MHIPNNFLDPKVSASLSFASAAAIVYCFNKVMERATSPAAQEAFAAAGQAMSTITSKARRAINEFGRSLLLKMAAVGSLIFVAQMFDFPVAHGTSGHLLGCALASIALGPWAGAVAMAAVLIIQCLLLGDGGLLALGANIFNMAIIGSIGAYCIYYLIRAKVKGKAGYYLAVATASWLSVVTAAAVTALEVGLSGTFELSWTLSSMVSVHAIVGVAEALITIAVLGLFNPPTS